MKKILSMMCAVLTINCFAANAENQVDYPEATMGFEKIANAKSPKEIDWEQRAKAGSNGNIYIYLDENGNPEIYVIGKAAVYDLFDDVENEKEADSEAEIDAKETFAKWLQDNIDIQNIRGKKTLIVQKGTKNSDGDVAKTQNGEMIITHTKNIKQHINLIIQGMKKFVAFKSNDKFISVWKWSFSEAKLAQKIQKQLSPQNTSNQSNKTNKGEWIFLD